VVNIATFLLAGFRLYCSAALVALTTIHDAINN
jgi:hypothetical protein